MSDENNRSFSRWYDKNEIVSKCMEILGDVQDSLKRKTATYLMDEIIKKEKYINALPEDIYSRITSEIKRRRRWYDFEEIARIFVELLKHCPDEIQKEIAVKAITFIENLSLDKNKSIELKIAEEDYYIEQ
ncbi:MAG: hypothetical protein V2B14_07310 [bacterium]